MPRFPLKANTSDQVAPTPPLALSSGHTLAVDAIDPVRRMVRIRVHGLNLPIEPGLAVLTISLKPGIGLVWAGAMIGVGGGLIALIRRARERRNVGRGSAICTCGRRRMWLVELAALYGDIHTSTSRSPRGDHFKPGAATPPGLLNHLYWSSRGTSARRSAAGLRSIPGLAPATGDGHPSWFSASAAF